MTCPTTNAVTPPVCFRNMRLVLLARASVYVTYVYYGQLISSTVHHDNRYTHARTLAQRTRLDGCETSIDGARVLLLRVDGVCVFFLYPERTALITSRNENVVRFHWRRGSGGDKPR